MNIFRIESGVGYIYEGVSDEWILSPPMQFNSGEYVSPYRAYLGTDLKDGQTVVEGKDYRKQWQTRLHTKADWINCTENQYNYCIDIHRRIIAIPVPPVEKDYKLNNGMGTETVYTPVGKVEEEKGMTAMQELIEKLKKWSPEDAPRDGDVSKAYHEGLQWAIYHATSLLEKERDDHYGSFEAGKASKEKELGLNTDYDEPIYNNAISYFNSKYKQ